MLSVQSRAEDPFRRPFRRRRSFCNAADVRPKVKKRKGLRDQLYLGSNDGTRHFTQTRQSENALLEPRDDEAAPIQPDLAAKASALSACRSNVNPESKIDPPPTPRLRPRDSSSLGPIVPDDSLPNFPPLAPDVPTLNPYSPLNHDDEIRLVRLLPGSEPSPVECRIIHSRLSELPRYSALSYVWGDRTHTFEIVCDDHGSVLEITSNCLSALKSQRHPTETRTLWIDAICIHQGNPRERNHQVRQMKQIYTVAESVVVFLSEHSENAEQLLEATKSHLGVLSMWDHLTSFFKLPYFSRIWMIQEVCFARQLEIHYGNSSFDERFFKAILSNPFHHPETLSKIPLAVSIRYIDHSDRTLWRLLSLTKRHQATEKRDKIIALLGVATDVDDQVKNFLVDYTKDEVDVWQYTLMYFFLNIVGISVPDLTSDRGYNWKRALAHSESNLTNDQDLSIVELYRASSCNAPVLEPDHRIRSDSQLKSIAQSGSIASLTLLESLWAALHTVVDPSSEAIAFASILFSASSKQSSVSSSQRIAITTSGEPCLIPCNLNPGDKVKFLGDPLLVSTGWPRHLRRPGGLPALLKIN